MWAFKALVARLIVAGVLIQSPILATAQESAEPKSGAKPAQTVTFTTPKIAQPPSLLRIPYAEVPIRVRLCPLCFRRSRRIPSRVPTPGGISCPRSRKF